VTDHCDCHIGFTPAHTRSTLTNDASILGWTCTKQTISLAILDSVGNVVMEAILETKAETILPRNTDAGSYFGVVGPRLITCKFSLLERGQKWLRNRVYPTSANSLFSAFFVCNEINKSRVIIEGQNSESPVLRHLLAFLFI
jgi:hypothetical protein